MVVLVTSSPAVKNVRPGLRTTPIPMASIRQSLPWSLQTFLQGGTKIAALKAISSVLIKKLSLTTLPLLPSLLFYTVGHSVVKNLPTVQDPQETRVRYVGWKDPLEKRMATHSSILAWRIPWTEEPGGLHP